MQTERETIMTLSEKVAYLKGLETGLNLNAERPETKMFNAIIDILQDVADGQEKLVAEHAELQDQTDAIDVDLSDLEDALLGCVSDYDDEDDEEEEEEEDDDDASSDRADDYDHYEYVPDEDEMYEVKCPSCGESIYVDEGVLNEGGMECPNCGEKLEFDIEVEDDDASAEASANDSASASETTKSAADKAGTFTK